jgi:cyclic pyranopterin phosphate synthase
MKKLTHIAEDSSAVMVDVSDKANSRREAIAAGFVRMQPATLVAIAEDEIAKGNVFGVARIAGIQAAKQTAQLIPLCHPLPLTHLEVNFEPRADGVAIGATARTTGPTGVEMEALTAVSVAALTIYDMCKAIDKSMVIGEVRLLSKTKTPI